MQLNIYNTAVLSLVLSGLFNWIILYVAKSIEFKKSSNKIEERLVDKIIPPLGGVATAIAFFIGVSFLGEADYNFALIDGFRDLENPDCDYVITLQNDAVLNKNWCECMLNQFKKYDFIVGYLGDNIVGYTPEIVKSVGLWDENFGGVANKCADYYFRGLLYHDKEKIQINDILHRRLVNYDHELELDVINDRGFIINQHNTSRLPDDEEHKKIREEENPYRAQQTHYFLWKWEGTRPDIERKGNWNEHGYLLNWPQDIKENNPTAPKQIQFVKYPYFEKGVTDIQNKGYITDGKLVSKHNTEYTIKEIKGIK